MRRKIFYDLFFLQPLQTVVVFIGEENSMSVSKANKRVNKIDFSFDFYELLFFVAINCRMCVCVLGEKAMLSRRKKSYQNFLYVQFSLWNPRLLVQKCVLFFEIASTQFWRERKTSNSYTVK